MQSLITVQKLNAEKNNARAKSATPLGGRAVPPHHLAPPAATPEKRKEGNGIGVQNDGGNCLQQEGRQIPCYLESEVKYNIRYNLTWKQRREIGRRSGANASLCAGISSLTVDTTFDIHTKIHW